MANIKSRLSPTLSSEERRQLSLHMLADVVEAAEGTPTIQKVLVVSPDEKILKFSRRLGAAVLKERAEGGVNRAVSKARKFCSEGGTSAMLILPSDIPLLSSEDLERIVNMGIRQPSVVLSPSLRLDGTNALLLNPPGIIPTFYEHDSFRAHLREALGKGIKVGVYLSWRIMLDLDEPQDLGFFLQTAGSTQTHRFLAQRGKSGISLSLG